MAVQVSGPSERQLAFIAKLRGERYLDAELATAEPRSVGQASRLISLLLEIPKIEVAPVVVEPGVYEVDGSVYVVKFNREKTRVYAKRLVEIGGVRATEAETRVNIEFEYDAGAIRLIRPEHRMDMERAKELTLRYGRCLNCGRHLKDATSVERGIGPVCIKSFRIAA